MFGRRLSRTPGSRLASAFPPSGRRAHRRAVLATLLLAGGLGVGATVPTVASAETAEPPNRAEIARWKGRICTPLGCAGPRGSTLASVAGFGAAVLAAGAAARRSAARRAAAD